MSLKQQKIISEIEKGFSFPHHVRRIKILETHISWIILTGPYAYKIKKEIKFGNILDFSDLSLRKEFCKKELDLNRFLCGDLYKKIVKLIIENNAYKFVELKEKGMALEYAIKMVEVPQKFRMDLLLKKGNVNKKIISNLTNFLFNFHNNTKTNSHISSYSKPSNLKKKFYENFETLSKLGRTEKGLEDKLNSFLKNNTDLFYERITKSKIRDIHGDLYLKNIFIVNNKFYLYDRIEFNDSLRYADVVEDVAHLAMDLDFYGRTDLSRFFISKYIKLSLDKEIELLVYFMMCYKACVRAKVSLFRKIEVEEKKKEIYENDAKKLLLLATKYSNKF